MGSLKGLPVFNRFTLSILVALSPTKTSASLTALTVM